MSRAEQSRVGQGRAGQGRAEQGRARGLDNCRRARPSLRSSPCTIGTSGSLFLPAHLSLPPNPPPPSTHQATRKASEEAKAAGQSAPPPPMSLGLVMGDEFPTKMTNLRDHFRNKELSVAFMIFEKR